MLVIISFLLKKVYFLIVIDLFFKKKKKHINGRRWIRIVKESDRGREREKA